MIAQKSINTVFDIFEGGQYTENTMFDPNAASAAKSAKLAKKKLAEALKVRTKLFYGDGGISSAWIF